MGFEFSTLLKHKWAFIKTEFAWIQSPGFAKTGVSAWFGLTDPVGCFLSVHIKFLMGFNKMVSQAP